MIPALVVPPVATTAITSSPRGWVARASRRAGPVSRWSSQGTSSGSMPSTWSALPTEEWASSLMATTGCSGVSSPIRCRAVSRPTMRPDRLPAEPPATKQPPAPSGRPARSASTPSAWFSAATGPAASIQDVPWSEEQDTTMSNRSAALVGAAGMKARNLGLSTDTAAVASVLSNTSMTAAGSVPAELMSPSRRAASDSVRAPP